MKMSYILIGTTIVLVGAAIYYLLKRAKESVDYEVTFKDVDTIRMAHIGEWLKTLDVDSSDFGVSRRIYVIKNVGGGGNIHIPDEIKDKLSSVSNKVVVAFVLSDMSDNTKEAVLMIGNSIEDRFAKLLVNEVTEIKLK